MGLVNLGAGAARAPSIVVCVRPTPEKSRTYLALVRSFAVPGVEYEGNRDGSAAYLTFKASADCLGALKTTQEIIWAVDRHNLLQPPSERYHVRIGIATRLDDTQAAESASTLAEGARPEQVLIDSGSAGLGIPDFMLQREEAFANSGIYPLRLQRLLKAAPVDFSGNGLVALYPDRKTLRHDLTPARLLYMAAPESEMLIAGRTLISWTRLADELAFQAKQKKLTYRFLVSSLASCSILGEDELKEIKRDYALARHAFERMVSDIPETVEVKETDQAVIDGVTCLQVLLPGVTDEQQRTLIVLQDVNAAPGPGKPTLVFACHDTSSNCACMAHGLYNRTKLRIDGASVPELTEPATVPLFVREEGLKGRNNNPSRYVRRMSAIFESVIREDSSTAPAPFCVQVQVSDVCSTHCKMCEQYIEQLARAKARPKGGGEADYGHGLSQKQWKDIFSQLGRFGVKATVFSGGEPLMRMNIHRLAADAKDAGLNVGLLTNGSTEWDERVRQLVLPELAERISWASVSVDGIADVDRRIRNPTLDEQERIAQIAEFASRVLANREDEPGRLPASVTLQKWNINSDLRRLCEFIHDELKIPVVNFKLATGAVSAVGYRPDYLLDRADLDQLQRFLWESRLPDEEGNNLSYLRRCFARGVFDEESAVDGAPLRAFYSSKKLRCFTPYTFALIDQDGSVYPCCHLFRDNHGHSAAGKSLRRQHHLGNLVNKDESGKVLTFAEIWRGRTYEKKRNALIEIGPNAADYAPCGECTRYCQHNISMNRLFDKYKRDPDAFISMPEDDSPVWF